LQERKRRTKMLRILSEKKLRYFYSQHAGKEFNVLFEADNKNGMMHGFTENYIKVKTPYDASLVNRVIRLTLGETDADGCALIERMDELVCI
jgi:threonylcarbamoyladenosine tRNA methylthiotransferase MtaB